MPVPYIVICECPCNGRCIKSLSDMGIVNNVSVVVVVDEFMILHLPEGGESGDRQEKADDDNLIFLSRHGDSLIVIDISIAGV